MRFTQFRPILLEGGNMFTGTTSFDQAVVPQVLKILNDALSGARLKVIPVGSGANPVKGKISNDFDVMTDEDAVKAFFKTNDAKEARRKLAEYMRNLGFETAQSGIIVHVLVPVSGMGVQADIMVTPQAEAIAKFHTHVIPQGSPFKGKNKVLTIAVLAKSLGYMFSPWQGLFKRTPDGKKGEMVTNDVETVAKILLGKTATASDLGSVESILAKLPKEKANKLLTDLRNDPNWEEAK
jgi:hypothetical protein